MFLVGPRQTFAQRASRLIMPYGPTGFQNEVHPNMLLETIISLVPRDLVVSLHRRTPIWKFLRGSPRRPHYIIIPMIGTPIMVSLILCETHI